MTPLVRVAGIAVAGTTLYLAGLVNSIVLNEPSREGAVLVVVPLAAALALLVVALAGDGQSDRVATGRAMARAMRGVWLFVSVASLVGFAWIFGAPRERGYDWTPYHNDGIALNECAARLVIEGRRPYTDIDLAACYEERAIGPDRTTPLRRGLFADVTIYPSDDELDAAWAARAGEAHPPDFVWRPSYPALSILPLMPWVAGGWDTNYLYLGALLAAMGLIVLRARADLRAFVAVGLVASIAPIAFTVGGSVDPLYALPLVAAWLWRERGWSAVAFGLAAAAKQLAWFFAPFLLIQWVAAEGWRAALRRAVVAAGVFAFANLPLAISDPAGWTLGLLTPVAEPMFPRGAGLVFLWTNGVIPPISASIHLALEVVAAALCLAAAWLLRRRAPELGIVLAMLPLFVAYRSLFSYFYLLPLFALGGVARLRLPLLTPADAARSGALPLLVAPRRGPS